MKWKVNADQLLEVTHSKWISELKRALKKVDNTADFLDKSKHFIFSTLDVCIEIIAWEYKFKILRSGRLAKRSSD
jgi:hypothetical protein